MIKIAFVIDTIESPTAGTEKQLLLLIRNLDRSRFIPYLCVLRSSGWLKQEFKDCELIDVGVTSLCRPMSYLNILQFASFLRAEHVDIVQTHFVDGNKIGIVAGKLAGVGAIVSTRRNQGYWHSRLELLLLKVLNRWVTRFLANSDSTRQWAAKAESLTQKRIEVIHNGLELELYDTKTTVSAGRREELGFPQDAVVIGIVANLRPVKAIDVFLRAAKIVSAKYDKARFLVVGDGPDRATLEQLCRELEIAQLVRFAGSSLEIPKLLTCMDIGVLSSSSESFSNSIVEYLAAGLPVVCTDVGGAREAVEDGVNGYVVERGDFCAMADGMAKIIGSGALTTMGQQSRERAERLFSLPAIMGLYEAFYKGVIVP
jgi:L-malate glycosyltransferase